VSVPLAVRCDVAARSSRFLLSFVVGAWWCLLAFAAAAQPNVVVKRGELDHNVGNVAPGLRIEYEVVFENRGDKPVSLAQNKRTCGHCEPLEFKPATIVPGKTSVMRVRERSGFAKGPQVRRSYVDTNDPKHPKLEVITRWKMVPLMEVRPDVVDFGRKRWNEPLVRTVSLMTKDIGETVKLTKATVASPFIEVGQPCEDVQAGRTEVPLTVLPTAPVGDFTTTVTLETTSKKAPRIVVPVYGSVAGPFDCDQRYVNFGILRTGEKASAKSVRITLLAPKRYSIEGLKCDEKQVDCRLEKEEGVAHLEVRLRDGLSAGTHRTTITLQTNCEFQKEILLPALAVIR
jgi:hypothetical protein